MVVVKKLLIFLFFVIGLILLFILVIPKIYYKNLGDGPYFLYSGGYDAIQSRIDEQLYLADILSVKYNDQCIIALRANLYSNKEEQKEDIYSDISFLVIDKVTQQIFYSENINSKKLLNKVKCNLNFKKDEITMALGKYNRRKSLYQNSRTR